MEENIQRRCRELPHLAPIATISITYHMSSTAVKNELVLATVFPQNPCNLFVRMLHAGTSCVCRVFGSKKQCTPEKSAISPFRLLSILASRQRGWVPRQCHDTLTFLFVKTINLKMSLLNVGIVACVAVFLALLPGGEAANCTFNTSLIQYLNASQVPTPQSDPGTIAAFFVVGYGAIIAWAVWERRQYPDDNIARTCKHARFHVDALTSIWGWIVWGTLAKTFNNNGMCGLWRGSCQDSEGFSALLIAGLFLMDILVLKTFLVALELVDAGWTEGMREQEETRQATGQAPGADSSSKTLRRISKVAQFVGTKKFAVFSMFLSLLLVACYPIACTSDALGTCITTQDKPNCVQGLRDLTSSAIGVCMIMLTVFVSIALGAILLIWCGCCDNFEGMLYIAVLGASFAAIVLTIVGGFMAVIFKVTKSWSTIERFRFTFSTITFQISSGPFTAATLLLVTGLRTFISIILLMIEKHYGDDSPRSGSKKNIVAPVGESHLY